MNKEPSAVKIYILDKEYLVACPEEEQEALLASARYLNDKMVDIRESGKVVGIDRIAVMTALNLAHEVIDADAAGGANRLNAYGSRIRKLNSRIEETLDRCRQAVLN
jgi:cell division protein ZapA